VFSLCDLFTTLERPDAEVTYHYIYDDVDNNIGERIRIDLLNVQVAG
jgi:hypothetical protein